VTFQPRSNTVSSSPRQLSAGSLIVFSSTEISLQLQKLQFTMPSAFQISILLYGCEAWVLYRHHIRALEAFYIRCLQGILGLRWWHKVKSHIEIRRRTISCSMECTVMQRQLRWVGHVIRMSSNRLPRRVLYGQLTHGERLCGAPKKRFSDHLKATLKKCHISFHQLEVLAMDRITWRDACQVGLSA